MRFVRVIVVLALIGSLGVNVIAITKWRSKRAIMSVNGQSVTKKDVDDYLEQQAGPNVKAVMVQRMLIEQEAKKLGVWPNPQEVEDEFILRRELDWRFARQMMNNPWQTNEQKANITYALAQERVRAKSETVTEEEMKDEYTTNSVRYDTPNKAQVHMALVLQDGQKDDIKQLMEKKEPKVSPTVIMQNYKNGVVFLGHEFVYTFVQPLGAKANEIIFNMKPGEVKEFPPQEFAQVGAKSILVRMEKIIPGKKADPNDPKIKERLQRAVALKRSKPWQEILTKLWSDAKFESENPEDRKNIELVLFPDRARGEAK